MFYYTLCYLDSLAGCCRHLGPENAVLNLELELGLEEIDPDNIGPSGHTLQHGIGSIECLKRRGEKKSEE